MIRATPAVDEDELEWRIKQMLGESLGCDVDELAASYRLKTDLGMEGHRAVGFFKEYGKEFGVDLKGLWTNWSFFFRPDGVHLSKATKLALIVAGSAGLLQWLLFRHFSALAGFVTVFGIFLIILASVKIAERMNGGPERPTTQEITVGDLIQAARTGRWKVPEEIEEWELKQEHFRPLI